MFGQIIGAIFGRDDRATCSRSAPSSDTLSFSREQEYQADTLGMSYMIAAGYDPAGAAGNARRAEPAIRASGAGPGTDQPPDAGMGEHAPAERKPDAARAAGSASATGRLGRGIRNRDMFLSELEGMFVDDDPAQGVIDGPSFTHPDLRIQFTRSAGLSDVERHLCGDDLRFGRQGAIQRRPLSAARSTITSWRVFEQLTARPDAARDPAAAAHDHQRHAGRGHDRAREHVIGRGRRERRRLSMGSRSAFIISSC